MSATSPASKRQHWRAAGLEVCWSDAVATPWLGGVGLVLAGAGEGAVAGLPMGSGDAGAVLWLVGVGLVGSLLVQSPSGVKRPMLPVTATVPGPGLMIAARVRQLRSRSLRPGWPEHPLARLLICLFPGMSPGSRSLRLGWQGCPLAQTLSCLNPGMPPNSRSLRPGWPGCPLARILTLNPVMWKLPERRPEAGPLSAGRVPWP